MTSMKSLVAFYCVLVFCMYAVAQSTRWLAVQGLSAGSLVEVRLSWASTVEGKLLAVSTSGMNIQTSDGTMRYIAGSQITKVYLIGKSHKLRDALIGAGVGAVGGDLYGAAHFKCYSYGGRCQKVQSTVAVGVIFGAIGAAIGAVISRIDPSRKLIYQRESVGAMAIGRCQISSAPHPFCAAALAHAAVAAQ